jgi:peptidoglycan/LPS O-acetylase OafA/YrhL
MLAYFYHYKNDQLNNFVEKNRSKLVLLSILFVLPFAFVSVTTNKFVPTIGVAMLYIGYGALLLVVVHSKMNEGKLGRFMASSIGLGIAAIGRYSYSIYLWHYELGMWLGTKLHYLPHSRPEITWICLMLIYLPGSLIIGVLMSKLVEYPTLKMRDKILPSRTGALEISEDKPSPKIENKISHVEVEVPST